MNDSIPETRNDHLILGALCMLLQGEYKNMIVVSILFIIAAVLFFGLFVIDFLQRNF